MADALGKETFCVIPHRKINTAIELRMNNIFEFSQSEATGLRLCPIDKGNMP